MADEQLPEGTDTIIQGASGVGDDVAPASVGTARGREASPSGKTSGADSGSTFGGSGAWFDRIEQMKSQGYDAARAYAETGKSKATDALDELIRSVSDAAAQIDARIGTNYGDYARRAADGIAGLNDTIKGKDVDELFTEARTLVAKAPAIAVGTAAALGFVVARLARAGLPETGASAGSDAAKTDRAA